MRIGRIHGYKKVLAQLLLLVMPTAVLSFYVLWDLNRYYAVLQNDWLLQGVYFTAGLALSTVFYAYRFRFVSTLAVLGITWAIIYSIIEHSIVGEFDTFLLSIQFLIFSFLFTTAWLAGYGFSRARWFTILWSVFLLVVQLVVVSKTADLKANALIAAFAPVLAYAVYIIYTAELIRNMNEDDSGFGWFVTRRMAGFSLILLLILTVVFTIFKNDFTAIEKEWGGMQPDYNKKGNRESMTKENKDGTISNKDQTKLTGGLNKGKRLVFVARLDNFFDDGKTPNPLYYTAYYYTKFDTLTQAFEMDTANMPQNDLFKPDPSRIPLYFSKTDSAVLRNTGASLNRKTITTDVYKVLLSPDEFLAPSTAFSVQPIGVPAEFKDQYRSAYRAKMWVSDLNSAYFIYNPAGDPMLEQFQEQRFGKLRQVSDFKGLESRFMSYYTFMPHDTDYRRITQLAQRITAGAQTPIDKMLAIRNYFLSEDEFGQPLFKYSDNPGIPGIPSANKLNYFLFENRKGYCAYYAGATLFMLRALGIPSRIAAGFLTIDRSSKNPGWYWFYEDQAHAWVQVYFPGYGWMDFDTTIPDVNTQQASQPDQTPPLEMQQVWLVADGTVVQTDTVARRITMTVNDLLYHDKTYGLKEPVAISIDASRATISADTSVVPLSSVVKGMHITAASYAEVLKKIVATEKDNGISILKKIPQPVPVDEIKIIEKDVSAKKVKKKPAAAGEPFDWLNLLWYTLGAIVCLVLALLAAPFVIWQYAHLRAKRNSNSRNSAFDQYKAATFYLNQLGYTRAGRGPLQYARLIDERFATSFAQFSNVYQKVKYSNQPLSAADEKVIADFYPSFIGQIQRQVPPKQRMSAFLNINHTIRYFTKPK